MSKRRAGSRAALCGERHNSGASEGLPKTGEHHKAGVQLHTPQPANAKRQQSVVVPEPSKLPLNGHAVLVEGVEAHTFPACSRERGERQSMAR